MITSELRSRAQRLATGLLKKDWPGEPVYVVYASDIDADSGCTVRGAFIGRSLHFCKAMGEAWDGPGRVLWLNDTHMAAKQTEGLTRRTFEADVLGVLVHEAAHAVLAPLAEESLKEQFVAELCASTGREFPWGNAEAYSTKLSRMAVDELPPLEERRVEHGADWHRSVIHCHWRAFHEFGELFSPGDVDYAAPLYTHTEAGDYMRALLPECLSRAAEPIRDIIASPLPTAFAELWERDTANEGETNQ